MRIVDAQGSDVINLEGLEPWIHFIEHNPKTRSPITRITYGFKFLSIEWNDEIEDYEINKV